MRELKDSRFEMDQTSPSSRDVGAWTDAVRSSDEGRIRAFTAQVLSAKEKGWLTLAGHVAYYHLQTGQARLAGEIYDRLLQQNPDNAEAHYFAFQAKYLIGQIGQGIEHLRIVLDRINDLPETFRPSALAFGALLLLTPEPTRPKGSLLKLLRSRIAQRILPGPKSPLGEISLALWRWKRSLVLRHFDPHPKWLRPHEDAIAAIRRVRQGLVKQILTKDLAPDHVRIGSLKTTESIRLYSLARHLKPKVIVQCGVYAGYSACLLAEACRQNGVGVVYGVDPNVYHFEIATPVNWSRELAASLGLSQYARFVEGVFATPLWPYGTAPGASTIPVVGPQVFAQNGPADMVLIDGDHSASSTLADLTLALGNLREEGVVLVHDTWSWPQVIVAVSALLSENRISSELPYGQRDVHYWELCRAGCDGLGMITWTPRVTGKT